MQQKIKQLSEAIGTVLLGKDDQILLALCCLFSDGHLLIEDLPGMGKTTLAHALARVLGLEFKRVQFTSDMLPSDVTGGNIYNQTTHEFVFHAGPVFTNILLADEINRTTPKTQSALLEAMEERQVSIEGVTHTLPVPFFVIATQNPQSQAGTYALPESQLDRFLMQISLGYPSPEAEKYLISHGDPREQLDKLPQLLSLDELHQIQTHISHEIHISDPLVDYVQRLAQYTRDNGDFIYGLSPRGALAVVHASKTWAYMSMRDHVLPEDVQHILPVVAGHRLVDPLNAHDGSAAQLMESLVQSVPVIE